MKILFVIDHLGAGGAEQQFVHIVNNVDAEKQVYLTEDKGVRMSDIDNSISVSGGHGKRTPFRSIGGLKNRIDEYKPDIVHSFLMYSCFITALTLGFSRHKPRFIAQEFSPPGEILKEVKFPALKKLLLSFTYKNADKVVTIARAVMESFTADGFVKDRNKLAFVHDGLDIEQYTALEEKTLLKGKLELSGNISHIAFVGSLVKRKGVDVLVKAFRNIRRQDIRLLIVGDGPLRKELIPSASGDPRIEFLGYKKNGIEYIKASDVFVLPSVYEGLPNVIIEAMAVGTPVIASNVSGIPELIEDGVNGLLVKPGDPEGLGNAIIRLLDDGDLREKLISESLKRAGHFSIYRMAKDYEALYREIMREPGHANLSGSME